VPVCSSFSTMVCARTAAALSGIKMSDTRS
jgi:hypothetical protein